MPEEMKTDVVQKTQTILGKHVKKPALTEKLLKKPPFRFLHDIINVVIKETGFLKGLFTNDELNSENVKERDAKIAFLTKLIAAVKSVTGQNLTVKPSKVIAGLEPTETNLLLQAIGRAIDKKLDSSEYVKKLRDGEQINNAKNDKKSKISSTDRKKTKPSTEVNQKIKTKIKEKQISNEAPKSTDRSGGSKKISPKDTKKTTSKTSSKKKENLNEIIETPHKNLKSPPQPEPIKETNEKLETEVVEKNEPEKEFTPEPQPVPAQDPVIEPAPVAVVTRKPSARPKSARPKSGSNEAQPQEPPPPPSIVPAQVPSTVAPSPVLRPKTSLRPPSVRPPSARPGAPRLRPDSALQPQDVVSLGKVNVIVESFDRDDEEMVVIQSNVENVEEKERNDVKVPEDNKGHLVEQILEQINEDIETKSKTEIEWAHEGDDSNRLHGKDSSKEIQGLRSLIQALTKTTNPLGKLLNYLHEDMEAMHNELTTWTNMKKQLFKEISKQKKITDELNKPLLVQLDNLKEDIGKVEEDIVISRNNIIRNELKIKELLTK